MEILVMKTLVYGDTIPFYYPIMEIKILNETLLITHPLNIAGKLNIDIEKYEKIYNKYLKLDNVLEKKLFKTYEGCKKFINSKELEPYIVMAKLIR